MARPSKEIKSAQEIKLSAAKKVANTLAITNRRIRVADLLAQHRSLRQIAIELEIAVNTVVADKRAIDLELAEIYTTEYQWRRERELEDFDAIEADIIEEIKAAIDTEEKIIWLNQRVKIKLIRAKWLGYDVVAKPTTNEPMKEPTFQDNRAVTNVYIGNSSDPDAKPFIQELKEKLMPALNEGATI